MIHYTCDRCKRQINTVDQARYVVQIEIQSVSSDPVSEFDEDVDQLNELHQTLEGLSDLCEPDDLRPDDIRHDDGDDCERSHRGRYDLCFDCHRQFLRNPLGRDAMAALGFSNN